MNGPARQKSVLRGTIENLLLLHLQHAERLLDVVQRFEDGILQREVIAALGAFANQVRDARLQLRNLLRDGWLFRLLRLLGRLLASGFLCLRNGPLRHHRLLPSYGPFNVERTSRRQCSSVLSILLSPHEDGRPTGF